MKSMILVTAAISLAVSQTARAEPQQVRTPSGGTAVVSRPANFQQCMSNSLKVGWDEARSRAWCSSPDRRFNRRN
jgi:hypothetical protein